MPFDANTQNLEHLATAQELLSPKYQKPAIKYQLTQTEIQKNSIDTLLSKIGAYLTPTEAKAAEAYAGGDTINPREEFKKLGWEVYDSPELKNLPSQVYEYRIFPDRFAKCLWNSSKNIDRIFSYNELPLISRLLDGNDSNDELKCVFVTSDDYLAFSILSPNPSIGKEGKYIILKELSKTEANRVRMVSPDFEKYGL